MIANMLDGVELILGAPASEWTQLKAETIVYTGRPDLVTLPNKQFTIAETEGLNLDFRTLDITLNPEDWQHPSVCLHSCIAEHSWTRKTSFKQMSGGQTKLVSTEYSRAAENNEISPFYPIEQPENRVRYLKLCKQIRRHYPTLHLAGRLGTYRYFDMYQAVACALRLADRLQA
jgi:UDP-galactopyranose mutase